jgi:hypothetical protein
MTVTCAERFAKKTNFAVTMNCAVLHIASVSMQVVTNSSAGTWSVKK